MKRKSSKSKWLKPHHYDAALTALLATGLAAAAGGTYWLAQTDASNETDERTAGISDALPPLHELLPPDPFRPDNLPSYTPHISASDDIWQGPAHGAAVEAAAPQLVWQSAIMPHDFPTIEPLPEPPVAPMEAFIPPPEPQDQGEEVMEDNEEAMPQMAEDDEMMQTEDDASPSSGDLWDDGGHYGGGFDAPTPQEAAHWDELFGAPQVPQSEAVDLNNVFLTRGITEERLLTRIVFDDPILDATGVTMQEHRALEIRNRNELWLRDGVDLTDAYFIPQLFIRIFSLADPSSYAGLVLYIDDEPLPWEQVNIEDGNAEVDTETNYDPNENFEAESGADEESINEQAANDPNANNEPYDEAYIEAGNPESFSSESDDFGDMTYEYHQGPDII